MQIKKYIVSLGFIGLGTLSWGQPKVGLVNHGAHLVIMPKTYLQVGGNITTQQSGQLVNFGTLRVGGNFTQLTQGSYTDTTNSFVKLVSHVEQILESDAVTPIRIANLSVNNQNGLTLKSHLALKASLELLPNNKLKLGDYNVDLAKDLKFYQIGSSNYLVTNGKGVVQQFVGNDIAFFYVGNSTYNPMQLINTGVPDTFDLKVLDEAPMRQDTNLAFSEKAVKRVWELGRRANGFPLIALELYWNAADELPNLDKKKTMIQFWGTLGSPFPYIVPAETDSKTNCWKTSNDLVQLIGDVNSFWITEPTGVDIKTPTSAAKVQPNPADSYTTLVTTEDNVGKEYSISNLSGNIVQSGKITSTEQQIDTSNLPAAIYFMNIGAIGTTRTKFVKL
jgi:Secretion system C-terminal sorting domain